MPNKKIKKNSEVLKEDLESEFNSFSKEFESNLGEDQKEVIHRIKSIIDVLDIGPEQKGFSAWPSEKLNSAKEKLSRYSESLGEWISFYETRSDFSYIWRKGKYASDWQPVKTELAKKLKDSKITNVEVENILTDKYLKEQYYSMFHRRRADYLLLLLETVDKMIRSIDSRLREIERQSRLMQDSFIHDNSKSEI